MTNYDPKDWYWFIGGDQTQVFSSARGNFFPVSDASYLAWVAKGNTPTNIDTVANLGAVLAPYLLRPTQAGVLDGYQNEHAGNIIQKVEFKVTFNHENRIRAVERALSLNGSPPALTVGQALAAVKALM